MKYPASRKTAFFLTGVILLALLIAHEPATGDPTRYPQLAQQTPANNVKPDFIYLEQLVTEITTGKKPLIIDVRSSEEYRESHILGSLSVPLREMTSQLKIIPKDRLVVFY